MKKALLAICLLTAPVQSRAEFTEIKSPEEMVSCMRSYIQDWLVAPAQVRDWEHDPAYEFAGKYLSASWYTTGLLNYGMLSMMVGPKAVVYCDYPVDSRNMPDRTKGFCKPTIENGNVMFDYYISYTNGREEKTQKKVAVIIDSKLYCLNIQRP